MALNFFLEGAAVAFSIAAPIGPTGILCIRRTLAYGKFSGLFSGLGAATANVLYGALLVSGLTLISNELFVLQFWLRLSGGAFLFYLGYKTFQAKPTQSAYQVTHKTLFTDFLSTFFISITNPITIISYLAVFAGLGFEDLGNSYHAFSLIVGIFCGATLWWIILTESVSLFRKKMTQKTMLWINRTAGIIIAGFGLLAWITLILRKLSICMI